MRTSSWWMEGQDWPRFEPLSGDHTADVVVVGAGITGLTTALLAARSGRAVIVLEAERIGAGTTGHTSAHLTVETDTDLDELRRRVGVDGARAAVQAGRAAIRRIIALDREMGGRGQVEKVPGYLWGTTEQDLERIERMAGMYAEYGENVSALVPVPLPEEGLIGMRFDDQAMFHPIEYLAGLTDLAVAAGVTICEGSEVVRWESGSPAVAATRNGSVKATDLVLATHTPPGMVPSVQARMAPYLSFLVVVRPTAPLAPALFWDMADPYHYIRPLPDGRVLVGGGDIKPGSGSTEDAATRLSAWTMTHLKTGAIDQRWAHMWFEPVDGLPFIGRLPARPGVWVATGFSGTGLTWGTFAAERIAAGIAGQERDDDRLFSPSRLDLLGSYDRLVRDQVDVMWHLIGDRLRSGGDLHPAELPRGQGQMLEIDGKKVGVYRDEHGKLHGVSPVCKHMGCIVGWNALDKTWDCPCHGGRFRADGTRFFGPPMSDLERRPLDDE